ncbi:MAG: hypothetical protein IPJ19_19405 [Planctomycetes bacterium]|nr:hypothetical protein [Planctomycetota bacterium]
MRRLLVVLGLALGAGACGYNAGLRVSEHHDSVGVEILGNDTYERDLEPEVHDELTRVLRDQSDAHLVDPRDAQAVVRGTISAFHRRGGIRNRENQLLETGLYIEVQAKLFVGGNEAPVRSSTAGAWVGYTLDNPLGNEREARQRAMRHIAEEIVLELFGPSGDG